MKGKRGCKRPGDDYPLSGPPFRWSSPSLQSEEDRIMYECPVGHALRTAPHTYDILDAASYCDSMSPTEYAKLPRYMQHAFRCVRSEKARLADMRQQKQQSGNDADYGARMRAGR